MPPDGQFALPRLTPERPREPLPVPPPPQQKAPGSVPGGPVRASIYMTNRVPPGMVAAGVNENTVLILKESPEEIAPAATTEP